MNSFTILQRLFTLRYDYKSPIDRIRAQLLLIVLAGGTLLASVSFLQAIIVPVISGVPNTDFTYLGALPLLTNLFVIYLVQTGRLNLASILIVGSTVIVITIVSMVMPDVHETPLFLMYLVPMALASLVFDRWQFNLTGTVILVIIIVSGLINIGNLSELFSGNSGSGILIHLLIATILSIASGRMNDLVKSNQEAVEKYDTIAHYVTTMPMISENLLLGRMLNLVRNDTGYAFAQVFLTDQRGVMTRRFRTGLNLPEGGVYSNVNIPDASALVEALRSKMSVQVSIQDGVVRREHFLPATQYGLIIPIQIGEQIVGVLDIQKTDVPFTEIEIKTLQHLVEHTATFTIYSRALDDFRSTVDNLRQSVSSLQTQLREYKQSEGDLIEATWMNYLDKRNLSTLGYDLNPEGIVLSADLPPVVAEAIKQGEIDVQIEDDRRIVRAPILIRGEVLGALVFNLPKERGFGSRQIDFTQSVTARLALALENKRLFEESRSQATREQKANEVASLLIGATDVDAVLKIAVDRFNSALGAVATRIHVDRQALELELTSPDNPLLNDGDRTS